MIIYDEKSRKETVKKVIIALSLLALTIVMILRAFKVIDFSLFFENWWALFIIIPSFASAIAGDFRVGKLFPIIIGILFLVGPNLDIDYWYLIVAFVLFSIGLSLLASNRKNKSNAQFTSETENFSVFLSGTEVDLSNQVFTSDKTIQCDVILGGVEISVPSNVSVELIGNCILGGVENNHHEIDSNYKLTIMYKCILGGIEVR